MEASYPVGKADPPVSLLGVDLFLEQSLLLARQRSSGEMVDNIKNKIPGVLLLGILNPFFKKQK